MTPTDEQVKTVAKALAWAARHPLDVSTDADDLWPYHTTESQELYLSQARAAIAAMQPTVAHSDDYFAGYRAGVNRAAEVVDECNSQGPYNAIGAARLIRKIPDPITKSGYVMPRSQPTVAQAAEVLLDDPQLSQIDTALCRIAHQSNCEDAVLGDTLAVIRSALRALTEPQQEDEPMPCPECGCEDFTSAGYLRCECPALSKRTPHDR